MKALAYDLAARGWAALRPLRSRAFGSRLLPDVRAPALLLSPHADDAVLDCWSLLSAPVDLRVVNVFGAVPDAHEPSHFERVAGACDAREHGRRRIAEDRVALARAGRSPVNLAFTSLSHRRGAPEPTLASIDAALTARVASASVVLAPAALGAPHPDHELVRSYALRLARAGMPVRLYADLPYCAVYGWPAWVTGEAPDPNLDVDAFWRASLDGLADACSPERAEVVALDPRSAAEKLGAMRTYRSEFATLDRGPIGQLSNPAVHGFEVFWTMPTGEAAP